MARAPFQVIVFPYLVPPQSEPLYAIFQRRRMQTMWQAISGGGEDSESPQEAAMRETFEETGICAADRWIRLDSQAAIPVSAFSSIDHWPRDLFVVPEYAFGVAVPDNRVRLSDEHCEHAWLPFLEAYRRLTWDSNKVALWELHCRVQGISPRELASPALALHAEISNASGDE